MMGCVEQHRNTSAFLQSRGAELLARHHALHVRAVADEHAALDRPQDHSAAHAVVDRDGGRVVENVDVAVLAVLDDQLLAVQLAGQTAYRGVLGPFQDVVIWINLKDWKWEV